MLLWILFTGVTIEMSLSKDQTLTVVVTGKEDQVKKARREVMTKLQTQVSLHNQVYIKYLGTILLKHQSKT